MSKFAMVLLAALLSALVLSSTASAGVSKYCSLLSAREIGRPLGISKLRTRSLTVDYPAQAGGRGKITLCTHKSTVDQVAETSVSRMTSAAGAKREFAAVIHREQRAGQAKKVRGAWTDAYFMGGDGFLVLKGRYMFHIQYASGAPRYSSITTKTLAGLAARAVGKL